MDKTLSRAYLLRDGTRTHVDPLYVSSVQTAHLVLTALKPDVNWDIEHLDISNPNYKPKMPLPPKAISQPTPLTDAELERIRLYHGDGEL